ncbi:hypothetical protein Nepgr_014872 [Nepenthes gracilis]|uniref:Secreted protein n=1 Tax=Nepenthes gracilis TaxID=150966 RepID=A0AAD3SML1_NEPGR|nr:hypothetical protein Nepgr_014872 [Nepenthes gracilis]
MNCFLLDTRWFWKQAVSAAIWLAAGSDCDAGVSDGGRRDPASDFDDMSLVKTNSTNEPTTGAQTGSLLATPPLRWSGLACNPRRALAVRLHQRSARTLALLPSVPNLMGRVLLTYAPPCQLRCP